MEELGLGRRLGTTPSGPYGVGGPALPDPPAPVSAMSESTTAEPLAAQNDSEPQAVSGNDDEAKDESAQKDTMPAATKPVKPDTKKWDTKKSDTKKSDRPKVRGLIDFNSKKKPKESPSSSSDEPSTTTQTSAVKTDSTAASHDTGSSKPERKAAA